MSINVLNIKYLAFRRRFFIIGIGLSWILIGCARSTKDPQTVLNQLARAVEKDRPEDVYPLLGRKAKERQSRDDFRRKWIENKNELKDFYNALKREKDQHIEAVVKFPEDQEIAMVYQDGGWKLKEGLHVGGARSPQQAIALFIKALETRDYRAAVDLMAKPIADHFEHEINARIEHLKNCSGREPSRIGKKAIFRFVGYRVELIEEKGVWRILRFD